MSLTADQLERFVADLAAQPERWRHLVRHSPEMRVHERIWGDEQLDAWLICWSADHDTGYHDHDVSAAAIAVVSGKVREDRLRLSAPASTRVANAGEILTVPPEAIHRVLHAGSAPAVTIHAYSPPLTRMGAYRTGADDTLQRVSIPTTHTLHEPALA